MAKTNTIIFIAIRFTSIIILIILEDLDYSLKGFIFFLIHFLYLIYFFIIRPFESCKENISEIFFQISFLTASLVLLFLKVESNWKEGFEEIYI
mmetsp:Transcript_11150/g.9886  ORF Transcript_11150/g.9886 Transcript_11150/m.9886 type:complete len:94 (+) Transcript_11150:750-1031(+)